MAKSKQDRQNLLRAIESLRPYPAVFMPAAEGGFEVIFPNLPNVRAYGPDMDMARKNAIEALTAEMGQNVGDGDTPPPPSEPDRLVPDPDEPMGTELAILEPDKVVLRKRFGLIKGEKGLDLGLGRLGRG